MTLIFWMIIASHCTETPESSSCQEVREAKRSCAAIAILHLYIAPLREGYRGTKIGIGENREWNIKGFDRNAGRHFRTRVRLSEGKAFVWEG